MATTRLTYCNFAVDETTEEQRASHRLREAAFCPRCVARWNLSAASHLTAPEICFTKSGARRHYARSATSA